MSEHSGPIRPGPKVEVHATPDDVFSAAAAQVAAAANAAVAERGRFCVALSGGSTPRGLFRSLTASPHRDTFPWALTHIFWSDERYVAHDHPDSNYRMAAESLLSLVPVPDDQIYRVPTTELPPREAAAAYSRAIAAAIGTAGPGLDLVLLGLGPDGHTASLFPGTSALSAAGTGMVANFVPTLDLWRLTLTLPEINRARQVLFLVTGVDKAEALADVLSGSSSLPAAMVRSTEGEVVWLVDQAAAGQIQDHAVPKSEAATAGPSAVEAMKQRAGEAAAREVTSGMVVGLGTGSTARYVVEAIGRRLASGELTDVTGVPTSEATTELARQVGIPLSTLADRPILDLAIDGTDEVTPELDLIKGLGGALLREKLVAQSSRRLIVVADAGKRVARLGERVALPVAVVPFAWEAQRSWLMENGADDAVLRGRPDGQPFVSDDGLYILDCRFQGGIPDPIALERLLHTRPGIVETGLFLHLTDAVYLADAAGVTVLRRPPGDDLS